MSKLSQLLKLVDLTVYLQFISENRQYLPLNIYKRNTSLMVKTIQYKTIQCNTIQC